MDPDVDPGWRFSARMLLFLVPGYLQSATRHADKRDGLELARQVWTTFTSALVLIGIVVLFIATKPIGSSPLRSSASQSPPSACTAQSPGRCRSRSAAPT